MSKLITVVRPFFAAEEHGTTLISVMVTSVLMALVAMSVTQLFSNQTRAMGTLGLMEKREIILKHYREVLVSGWDNTKQQNTTLTGAIAVYGRDNATPVIPSTGLYLGDDIYSADTATDGWWKVTATGATLTGAPINAATATLLSVTLKVAFRSDKHPDLKTKLADKELVVFFHHNIKDTNTDCDKDNANKAIIQYDFISNFKKCSKWPLVRISQSSGASALLGFDPVEFTAAKKYQLHTEYGGITVTPKDCGQAKYVTSISNLGEIACEITKSTLSLSLCRGYLNTISASGNTTCVSGPQGPRGEAGELEKHECLVKSCPSSCPSSPPPYQSCQPPGKQSPL